MKKHRISLFLMALPVCIITSCNKFLDQSPSKNSTLPVTTTAQLNSLLDNYTQFYSEANGTAIYSTDDYGWTKAIYDARPGTFSHLPGLLFPVWDTEFIPNSSDAFWTNEWKKIFTANMALLYIDKVTGTAEEKAIIKADAHFVKAYSYWQLANTYCLPFTEANKNEPGLPLKLSTGFEEPLARAPLHEVYTLIESSLQEALKTTVPLIQNGKPKSWRANKAAVNGFAARYFLNRNNYAEAIKHADAALSEYNTLVNYNTEMKFGKEGSYNIVTGSGPQVATLQFPYTHDNQIDMTDMLNWKETLYFRMLNHGSWWYIPSQDLLDLYDADHDLRYKYHIVESYSYDRGMTNPAYNYPGYIFFFKDRIPSGPTTAEMYLTKAEAQARSVSWQDALTTVNTLRASRMQPGPWVQLTAASKEEAITKILEERRREMPYTQRWFDLRRYNNNEDPADDVTLTRVFYPVNISGVQSSQPVQTYTLEKNSRRYAAPLPLTEIISSNGVIEQNKY